MTQLTQKQISAYLQLTKPRITSLVVFTALLGYVIAAKGVGTWTTLIFLILGTAATCAGASALNHYLERDVDSKMHRTCQRPLPQGLIVANHAMLLGVLLILLGVFFLWAQVNLLTAFLSLLSAFLYVVVYTPLKRLSWLNTTVGAIPGALPPLGGWAAAQGELSLGGWLLFLIMFFWQHPHFYSIAWMFREDYERGGLKMLPVVKPDGKAMFFQINLCAIALLVISIIPAATGMTGMVYLAGAVLMGALYFLTGIQLSKRKTITDARMLLQNSVIYLPALFILIILDAKF